PRARRRHAPRPARAPHARRGPARHGGVARGARRDRLRGSRRRRALAALAHGPPDRAGGDRVPPGARAAERPDVSVDALQAELEGRVDTAALDWLRAAADEVSE